MLLLFIGLLAFNKHSLATHIPGANITYTCDPANPLTYTFTLTLFRVCPGTHPATMASSYFTLTNTCGLANPVVPIFNQVGVAEDVNQLCATATSDCSGGTSPGLWKYTYQATITLPANCDSWNISFDLCCRDQSTNMSGGTGNNMYTETTMNTMTAPCNNSPVVTSVPMPYACANTTFNYCLSIADPEGDSTYFSMIPPMGIGGAPIVFNAGYTAAAPIANFTLDPLTGCISFNSPITGNFVVNIQIDSYDDNGDLIASVVHDFQVIVMSCTNTPPSNPSSGITNFSGTGAQLGSNTIGLCYGDNICFDVVFADSGNPSDVITIQQDGTTLLPGATFVQTGTNPATGTFCWTAQPGYTSSIVTFVAEDDGCPVMGTSGFAVDFAIATGVYAGSDPIICGSQTATLTANGATAYTWSPATGLSCTNCPNPIASPASTTTYTLTGNLVGTCPNTDQVTVNVVPDFTPVMNPLSATICANEIVQLDVSGPGSQAPYTYTWSPSATLSASNIANPLANPLTTTTYTATITSSAGCVKQATADVIVSGIGPTVEIAPSTIDICQGESVPLTTTAKIIPVMCGPSAGCTGTTQYAAVGTSATSTTVYTPFYGSITTGAGYDYNARTQYIYTAQELAALGFEGGTIKNLSLRSTTSYTYNYDDVEIWIGCTSSNEFTSTAFESTAGMSLVYSASNVDITNNNWHLFDITDWDWDGVSNVIIQICGMEGNPGSMGSESFLYSTTSPYYRCMYYLSTTAGACTYATGSRVTNRPNMRFGYCEQTVTSPVYAWSPGTGLSSTSTANPTATPSTTTSYVLDVTSNGCTGSGVAQINVSPDYTIAPSASPISLCYGSSTTLNANLSGAGPYTYAWSPGGAFTNPTTANPTVTPTGTTTYYIATSNGYCNKLDSVVVNVAGLPASAIASEDTVCQGDLVNLDVLAASATCGINYADCNGSTSTGTMGTSVSATSTYGPFYGSTAVTSYKNKKQMIFTAAELNSMGFTAGTFTELAINVSTATGRSYNDLTIWMGCTPQEQYLDANFISTSSMSMVYFNSYYTTTNGWNTFDITGFDWDGVSNIVIQYCAEHADLVGSESVYYTSTSPYYSIMYYNTTAAACANATGTRTYYRPDTRFTMCSNNFAAGASYSWSPSLGLSSSTVEDPTATVYSTTTYTLTVTDPSNPGCPSTASVQVAIDPSNSVVASADTLICPGDSAPLNSVFSGPVPTTVPCGLNVGGCTGATETATVGTAYSYTTTYSPFYGSYYDTKMQYLYSAAELTAMGLESGTITQIAFNVPYKYSTGAFGDFTIRMGCTNETSLVVANGWLPTQGPVWGPANYTTNVGMNTFVLTTGFDWDGVSNIVIETCFNNNAAVSYDYAYYSPTTGYNTTMRNYSSVTGSTNGCNLAPLYVYAYRPDLTFTVCAPPPASPVYSWSPAATLDDPTIPDPTATPVSTTSYVITVTGGVCTVYDTVNVGMCNPLPIELISFGGHNNGPVNELYWTTASEEDNDYFVIQRSANGTDFVNIGTEDAMGTSSSNVDYRMLDQSPIIGVNYYRLKQVDYNGAYSYSETIAINTDRGAGIQIYPNPATDDLFIDIGDDLEEGIHTVLITDVSGKILNEQINFSQNSKTYKIANFSKLSSGIYLIKILDQNEEMIKVAKVTKK